MASSVNAAAPVIPPARSGPRIYSREAVLVGCCASLLLLLGFTAFVNRVYHRKIHMLADEWAAKGDESAKAGDLEAAITEYRNAMVYSPNNGMYQFHLAQVLADTGKNDNEAQNYLTNLWAESPGSGPINLALARVASHKKDGYTETLRYYHSAIDGEWTDSPVSRRWDVRKELCEFLLRTGKMAQARVEVMALADNTPPDDTLEQSLVAGQLLLRTQEWERALDVFRPLASGDHAATEAIVGAGTAAFNLGQYAVARDYFFRVPPDRRSEPDVAPMVTTAHQVLAADPYLSGISKQDRAMRAENALKTAADRLQACLAMNPPSNRNGPLARAVTQLQQNSAQFDRMSTDWGQHNLASFPDRLDDAMALAFSTENAAATACGEPQGKDRPLWLLGRSRVGQSN